MIRALSSEETVIAAAIERPDVALPLLYRAGIKPECLAHPARGAIVEAVYALDAADARVWLPSVVEYLDRTDFAPLFRSLGGLVYVAELVDSLITVENLSFHLDRVRMAVRRRRARWLTVALHTALGQGDADRARSLVGELARLLDEPRPALWHVRRAA